MIRLEIRHRGVMSLCVIEDKTVVVVVASYRSVSKNRVRFKALFAAVACCMTTFPPSFA